MALTSPDVVASLVRFISDQVSRRGITHLVPLESKGALLLDLASERMALRPGGPRILYLRSLEFLPPDERSRAVFGVFDDFVFSGRTIGNAVEHMRKLGIPSSHIWPMAFFKFGRRGEDRDVRLEVLAETAVPEDNSLLRLSQDEILRDVQRLAIEHKIPASYDNLEWFVSLEPDRYSLLMRDLAATGCFLHYGRRGDVDASALVFRPTSGESLSVLPKIRFWYNATKGSLRLTPLAFSTRPSRDVSQVKDGLIDLLTPEEATARQDQFARYQATAIRQQVALLGYLKPFLRKHSVGLRLNTKQIDRYFGPRSQRLSEYLERGYEAASDRPIPAGPWQTPARADYYTVALEMMRTLGGMYWNQPTPRRTSQGLTVAELIDRFGGHGGVAAVHAAIDYCADMNLIATFYGWKENRPYRAFRLTENGEQEVGRGEGFERRLSFLEKLGALILDKCKKKEAPWWVLEKVPAILSRRLQFPLPQLEVSVGYFGDVTLLRPNEDSSYALTWPRLRTDIWHTREVATSRRGPKSVKFTLNASEFARLRHEILQDPQIMRLIGPIETVLELTRSATKGHHVAILLDILSDRSGGTTYLAYAAQQAVRLIEHRTALGAQVDRRRISIEISNWLAGLDEKIILLSKRKKRTLDHAQGVAKRLERQGRGDVAALLLGATPFPEGNTIIPAFAALSSVLKEVNKLASVSTPSSAKRLHEIATQLDVSGEGDEDVVPVERIRRAIKRWSSALSGDAQGADVYLAARLNVPEGESRQMFVVAYDLIGSSTVRYTGRAGAERDRYIQSVISNWFIAFGGYAQRAEFGGGDLGFGFFSNAEAAIQASLWAGYYLELLKGTNPTLQQEFPHAGFGIVQDTLRSGFMNQVKSDWLSRFAKAWKREAERMADTAGRAGEPVVAIHADMFSDALRLPTEWFSRQSQLDGIPVRFVSPRAMSATPWTRSKR